MKSINAKLVEVHYFNFNVNPVIDFFKRDEYKLAREFDNITIIQKDDTFLLIQKNGSININEKVSDIIDDKVIENKIDEYRKLRYKLNQFYFDTLNDYEIDIYCDKDTNIVNNEISGYNVKIIEVGKNSLAIHLTKNWYKDLVE